MHDRVDLGLPLELEVIAKLLTDSSLDSLLDVLEDAEVGGVLLVVVTTLEDTSADKTGVPAVHISTDDIGGGVVTDHVDVLGELLLAIQILHPVLHHLIRVDVGGPLGLTIQHTLEVVTGGSLVHSLDTETEGTEVETWGTLVLGGAEEITLREVDGDVLVLLGVLGAGEEVSVLGHEKIVDDLEVGHHIPRLGEAENGIELDLGEVAGAGALQVLLGKVTLGGDRGVPGNNVLRVDDVLEPILLSHVANLVTFATADQHGVVVLSKSLHGSVGLNELVEVDRLLQNLGELLSASGLSLTTTVGEENVGELDACGNLRLVYFFIFLLLG